MANDVVLVTGASGFVGSEVVRRLLAEGVSVRAMVRSVDSGSTLETWGAEVVVANLKEPTTLLRATKGVASIIHIAAIFREAGLPSDEYYRVNVEGTRNLIEASIQNGVNRFVYCSTVGVHGGIDLPPADENYPYNPGDVYQRSKAESERLVLDYFAQKKLRGVVIRPAMVYGPNDQRTLKLFKMISKGRFFYVGEGKASVHFVDVRDLARAFYLALIREDLNNEVFIIAGKKAMPLHELTDEVASILKVSKPWIKLPIKPVQILGSLCELVCTPLRINPPLYRRRVDFFTKNRAFDCGKAESKLGFIPTQDMHDELVDIINSYIEAGCIEGNLLSAPGTIVRNIDGSIRSWDRHAEKLYGWEQAQVVGQVTHSLLRTSFPSPLERINEELHRNKRWVGNLIHSCSDGKPADVLSRWELYSVKGTEYAVVEINRLRKSNDTNRSDRSGRNIGCYDYIFVNSAGLVSETLGAFEYLFKIGCQEQLRFQE